MVDYVELSREIARKRQFKYQLEILEREEKQRIGKMELQQVFCKLRSGMMQWNGVKNFHFIEEKPLDTSLNLDDIKGQLVICYKEKQIHRVNVNLSWWSAINKPYIVIQRQSWLQSKFVHTPEEALEEVAEILSHYMV